MPDRDTPRNVPASILQRLYNRARAQREDYNLLLSRFAMERLLYRLGISSYADDFVLKGAHLFTLWSGAVHRPTRDIDLHCEGEPAIPAMEAIFRVIVALPSDPPDGIAFEPDIIHGEEIREEARYVGIRFPAFLRETYAAYEGIRQVVML